MNESKVVVTEQTAKRWKLMQTVGFVVLLIGLVWSIAAFTDVNSSADLDSVGRLLRPVCVMAVGFVVWAFGRFLGWWFHG